MEEKYVNIYISSDQHKARFQKLEKALTRTNGNVALLMLGTIGFGILVYFQQKQIDELEEKLNDKKDERAE